jgi:CHAT domain-containing protein/tetratricopeptide (TPR) repeat protein
MMSRRLHLLLPLALCTLLLARPAACETSPPVTQDIRSLIDRGRYAEAERTARARLDGLMRTQGTDSLQVASLLDLLTEAMRRGGRGGKPEARQFCERGLRIKADRLGTRNPDYAASLYQLGFLDYVNGDLGLAKPTLEQALAIRESTLGRNHRDVAESLIPLAGLLSDRGDNAKAESLFTRAQAIRVREFGPTSAEVGECLSALATLRFRTGDFAEAASTYEQALPILRQTLGPTHSRVGTCLNNLGALFYELGDYEAASADCEQALTIRRNALGRSHELVASTLVNLAKGRAANGQVSEAATRYREALAIQTSRFGPDSPEAGRTRSNLGLLELQIGVVDKAQELLLRAVSDLEHQGSGDAPELADALAGLAMAEVSTGNPSAAKSMCERALDIRTKSLGPRHPDVGLLLIQYSRVLAASGDEKAAFETALRGEDISREHLRLTSRGLAERQAIQYAGARPSGARVALHVLACMEKASQEDVNRAWDSVVRGRTLVLDEIASRNRSAIAAQDSASTEILTGLGKARRRLANLLVAGPRGSPPARYRSQLDQARNEMERQERALASRSVLFRRDQERQKIGLGEVASTIPRDAALVAFAAAGDSASRSYVAFVLHPPAKPTIVPLGTVVDVDGKVSRWLDDIARDARTPGAELDDQLSRRSGVSVIGALWDPLAHYLKNAKRILIVPEGSVHLVNFAALPVGRDGYLIERGIVFHYLTAERDLVPDKSAPDPGIGLLVLGDPAYDGPTARRVSPSLARSRGQDAIRPDWDCFDFDSLRFGALPGTGREVENLVRLWGDEGHVMKLMGPRATERMFKANARGRKVLHIATHGFFLGKCSNGNPGTRGIGATVPSAPAEHRKPDPRHPLLIAGFALAGANRRSSVGPDDEDGILTAEEIAGLNLSGVQWAVLSACDTGNGRVIAGEGILGLQRAFQVAGVRSVIMSLWAVDDDATREWMGALYERRLHRNEDTATAVTDASLEVLRERKAQARSSSPFYWAGFVASGDWR